MAKEIEKIQLDGLPPGLRTACELMNNELAISGEDDLSFWWGMIRESIIRITENPSWETCRDVELLNLVALLSLAGMTLERAMYRDGVLKDIDQGEVV